MESKIEKLERIPDDKRYYDESDFVKEVIEKINMIIDHLNSQDQEEENTVCEGCGKTITSRFMQSYTKGDGMHSYCLSCDPEKQDTPEEEDVQEWEERFMDVLETFKDEICSNFFASSKPLTDFIKQLLLERERWAIDTFLKDTASYNSFHNGRPRTMRNGLSGEGFEVRVSKLTTK